MAASFYWDADTAMSIAANKRIEFLIKYDSQGQFQWLQIPVEDNGAGGPITNLSVSPSGELFWFSLLDTGVYGGGTFTINNRQIYAINYDAGGNFQAAVPLDMNSPATSNASLGANWDFDPATNRFYCWLNYTDTVSGSIIIGNTPLTAGTPGLSTAVLAAFDRTGQNLWVRQGSTTSYLILTSLDFGDDGTVFLAGQSQSGSMFCGDTTPGTVTFPAFIMAVDTNAQLLWSNYSVNNQYVGITKLSHANNTLTALGDYVGTISWDNQTVTNPVQYPSFPYFLMADASTGAVLQLMTVNSNLTLWARDVALDKNDNLYVSGDFTGRFTFANDSLSCIPDPNNSQLWNSFLLKYKNVVCNCDLLEPTFNFSNSAATTFQFTYTGQTPYASISWDFGDGTTVTGVTSPTHTYAAAGTYPVCVTVTNGCGSNTSCKYVSFTTGIKDAGGAFSSVSIYPNPAQDQLTITNLPEGTTVEVLDLTGRLLKRVQTGNTELRMNVEGLSAGVHLLRFTDKEGRRGSSMFVKR